MTAIDINCDMGEGLENEELLMPFISSANIACGFHAGNENTMERVVSLAMEHRVAIGAHPSFFDPKDFGRAEQDLPPEKIYDIVLLQLRAIKKITDKHQTNLHHVKPHGALYNMSARDPLIASAIAEAVKDFDQQLILFGLANSASVMEAEKIGLRAGNEVFADRSYQDDGSLIPRSNKNALLDKPDDVVQQVLLMIRDNKILSVNSKTVTVRPDTICIHGDGQHAVLFAREIFNHLKEEQIEIRPL